MAGADVPPDALDAGPVALTRRVMAQWRRRAHRLTMVTALLCSTLVTTVGAGPAAGQTTTTVAAAPAAEVSGGACGYFANVGLFGGPRNVRGCGQPSGAPETNASPSVTLPAAGSSTPVTATDADGAMAEYGPAKIFSGKYPDDPNAAAPPSGPLTVSTQGTPAGDVTSSASVMLPRGVGPSPVVADGVRSTCTATGSGVRGSTTITNGSLVTSTTPDGSPLAREPVPADPPVNYTRTGVITNIGDSFRAVYNEQSTEGGSITVNAVHLYLLGPTAVGELVIGQSRCGRTAVAGSGAGSGSGSGAGAGGGAGSGAGMAGTGADAVPLVAVAMLLVAAGAHASYWAPRLARAEATAAAGRRRRPWPRPVRRPRRRSPKRPWD